MYGSFRRSASDPWRCRRRHNARILPAVAGGTRSSGSRSAVGGALLPVFTGSARVVGEPSGRRCLELRDEFISALHVGGRKSGLQRVALADGIGVAPLRRKRVPLVGDDAIGGHAEAV